MDRKKAYKILDIEQPAFKNKKGTTFVFARQGIKEVERIEELTNDELMNELIAVGQMIDIISCFSIADIQDRALLELEAESRKDFNMNKYIAWLETVEEKAEQYEMSMVGE